MNIFVPQSLQTQIELDEIADVKRQIISPRLSTPIIGIVQDGLLGSYNLSHESMKVEWKDAMNMVSYTTLDDFSNLKKSGEYKGSDIFSMIIPSEISTGGKTVIKKGHIEKGQISKTHLGAKQQNSLVHLIYDQYGMEETKTFLDNTQRLVNNFNLYNGFTVGIGDIDISPELEREMSKLYETKKLEVNHIITEMENNPDLYDPETFEQSIYGDLNNIRDTVSKLIMNNLKDDNKFNIMISSGAKGGAVNMAQMAGCLGQQAVEGSRIKKKVNGRSLPYFYQNDDSATARGFVEEPFLHGMTPQSFIFHNMGSREGLIDTAIKSVTGDTAVIIETGGVSKRVLIGDWIDGILDNVNNKELVQHYKERDMELLEMKELYHIPTADEDGNVSWGVIKNITRHDPGLELYKIKTLGGREVIVTESKSLLIWNKEMKKFLRTSTPEVTVGDFVPVTMHLPELCEESDQRKYRKEKDYLDGKSIALDLCFVLSNMSFAITKSLDYIKGFLEVHFDGELCIIGDSMILNTTYSDINLSDSLNHMLSRFGIFTEIETDKLIIKNEYITKFANTFKLKDTIIQKINNLTVNTNTHETQNDVVLDEIVLIEKVDIVKYPKVYDLTIPSTLNFGLANGLHVVDTAESGYIQRKLIKSMEDAHMAYDLTMRNGNNTILQFAYGDNSIDTIKQSKFTSKLILLGNKEVGDKYKFTTTELKNYSFSTKDNDDHYQDIISMRDTIRTNMRRSTLNYIRLKDNFMLPVNLVRLVDNVKNNDMKSTAKLEPKYIIDKINELLEHKNTLLFAMSTESANNKNSLKYRDETQSKTMFKYALFEYLSPKISLLEHKVNKAQFDEIYKQIVSIFNKAVIEPGEMVGIIAAQSIGEPVTQIKCGLN
jgi:hypothetical protein